MYFEDQGTTDLPIPADEDGDRAGATVDPASADSEDPFPGILDASYDTDSHGTGSYDPGSDDLGGYGPDDYDPASYNPASSDPGSYATDGYDTDGDGRQDTVLITGPAGGPVLLTDIDGDGVADVATEITGEGRITVSEHTGDGQWTVVERSRLGGDGPSAPADLPVRADDASVGFASSSSDSAGAGFSDTAFSDTGFSHTVVSIDPITGEWVHDCPAPVTAGWSNSARPTAPQE